MPGEAIQAAGRDGALLAKRWLEGTGNVLVPLVAGVSGHDAFLAWEIAGNHERSFDLFGYYGASKKPFFAEVKHYHSRQISASKYYDFLALCYCRALARDGALYDFMFITWHPFLVTRWSTLRTADCVRRAIDDRRHWLAEGQPVSDALCRDISTRLWMIVLSDRSGHLQLPPKMARAAFLKLQAKADRIMAAGVPQWGA